MGLKAEESTQCRLSNCYAGLRYLKVGMRLMADTRFVGSRATKCAVNSCLRMTGLERAASKAEDSFWGLVPKSLGATRRLVTASAL